MACLSAESHEATATIRLLNPGFFADEEQQLASKNTAILETFDFQLVAKY